MMDCMKCDHPLNEYLTCPNPFCETNAPTRRIGTIYPDYLPDQTGCQPVKPVDRSELQRIESKLDRVLELLENE